MIGTLRVTPGDEVPGLRDNQFLALTDERSEVVGAVDAFIEDGLVLNISGPTKFEGIEYEVIDRLGSVVVLMQETDYEPE